MSLVLFHYLLFNMFQILVHPSSEACDLLRIYFMCCIALVQCALVLRCGSAGIVWYPYAGVSLHKDTTRQEEEPAASCCISFEFKHHKW